VAVDVWTRFCLGWRGRRSHHRPKWKLARAGRQAEMTVEDRSAETVNDRPGPLSRAASPEPSLWPTFGPHPIGAERFATVSSGLQR
jgi:hypothetical protein